MKWSDVQVGDVIEHEGDTLLVVSASEETIIVLPLAVESDFNEAHPGVIETWPRSNGAETVVKYTTLLFRREE